MNLSKLGLVREFIDYMIKEYSKDLYFCYRASGYTPQEIMSKPCWEDRTRDCLDLEQISYNTGVSLDEYIDGFSKDYYGLSYETHCGAQQVAFIFDDGARRPCPPAEKRGRNFGKTVCSVLRPVHSFRVGAWPRGRSTASGGAHAGTPGGPVGVPPL